MDRFITHEGLLPFFLGDIDFMGEVFRDTISKIVSGLGVGAKSFVLSGVNFRGDSTSINPKFIWDDGVVVVDGEIYSVKAGSKEFDSYSDVHGVEFGLKIEVSYDERGRRTMKSGEVKECYQIRKAVVVSNKEDNPQILFRHMKSFEEIIAEHVKNKLPSLQEDAFEGEAFRIEDMGAIKAMSQCKICSIFDILYLSFELNSTREIEPAVLYDAQVDLIKTGNALRILTSLKHNNIATTVTMIKSSDDQSRKVELINVPCSISITPVVDSQKKVNIRIKPANELSLAKYECKAFVRLEY